MVTLKEDELKQMLEDAVKAGVSEYKRQETKEKKRDKYHDTFSLMRCYRDAVFHRDNAISEAEQLELDKLTIQERSTYLQSIRRTRFKTMLMLGHIDKAVEEIEARREASGRYIEYQAFEMYFMLGLDYPQIAEELNASKNTPRRWISSIINELTVLLWGIDDER